MKYLTIRNVSFDNVTDTLLAYLDRNVSNIIYDDPDIVNVKGVPHIDGKPIHKYITVGTNNVYDLKESLEALVDGDMLLGVELNGNVVILSDPYMVFTNRLQNAHDVEFVLGYMQSRAQD